MTFPLAKRLAAECLGTGLLVTTVVGSGIMGERLAGGNVALALLGNTLPTGAILVVLILALGPISGAHFNPAVSLVMSLRKDHPWREFFPYAGAQIIGGCIGTLVAHGMFELPLLELAVKARTGPAQWFAEFVATFGSDRHHSRRVAFQERGDSGRGRSLHNCRLLVHGVDVLRQSGRHDRPRVDKQLFRDRADRRSDVHRRAAHWRVGGARRHELVFCPVDCSRASDGGGADLMRWAIWSASALLLATVSFAAGRFSSFRPLPEIVATLPGDESEFSREFDGRIRERFLIGSSEDKLVDFLVNEGFFPDWRRRDNPNASFFVQSGLICTKIARVLWRADPAGILTQVGGSYQSQCI